MSAKLSRRIPVTPVHFIFFSHCSSSLAYSSGVFVLDACCLCSITCCWIFSALLFFRTSASGTSTLSLYLRFLRRSCLKADVIMYTSLEPPNDSH